MNGPATAACTARLPQPLRLLVVLLLLLLLPLSWSTPLVLVFALAFPPAVPLLPLRPREVLVVYLPFAAVWLLFVVGYLQAAAALGHPIQPQPLLEQVAQQGASATTLPILLGGIVLAPLLEELLFRGYLLGSLLLALPAWPAQIATAALFGLAHGLAYALPIGVLGLLFGWLRQRHGALAPPLLAHAVHNGATFAIALLWPDCLDLIYPR